MIQINVSSNIRDVARGLSSIQRKQIPFAASRALNDVAFEAGPKGKVLADKADKTFRGGATRFTQRGFKVKKSNKRDLTAVVFVDEAQAKYMRFQIRGGIRFPLRNALMISTDKTRLNRFGNITPATYRQMINNKTKYFKGVPNGKSGQNYEGIWERYGRSKRYPGGQRIRMVARYIDKAQYRPLFPFAETTQGVVFSQQSGIAIRFRKRLAEALRTAK
tara:strand:+ start:2103 stop:2759 length:657 start_codon:yes stop_codon:yes gene_type:complete